MDFSYGYAIYFSVLIIIMCAFNLLRKTLLYMKLILIWLFIGLLNSITHIIVLLFLKIFLFRFYSVIAPGDTIHVIGKFDDQGKCDVDHDNNFLIVHPDILVSGTRVIIICLLEYCAFSFSHMKMFVVVFTTFNCFKPLCAFFYPNCS